MGIYLRKSIAVGPFRFNLSKSGLGVSAGIKGLRIGTGPRGNYVRIGTKNIYYRSTIASSPSESAPIQDTNQHVTSNPHALTHEPLKEIDSAHVTQIVDSSSSELLNELNDKRKKSRIWPIVFIAFLGFTYLLNGMDQPEWIVLSTLVLGLFFTWVSHTRDMLAKTTVLFYDFEPEMETTYNKLFQAAERLEKCRKAWHISASGKVLDKKYHAGASNLVDRKTTTIQISEPPYLQTNVKTVSLAVGRQTLHFFPDRVLVYDAAGVGAVSYQKLLVTVRDGRFIEDEAVPSDALIVDKTWKYVNKSGGPDRRFKNNHELPICLYQEMTFTSSTGLNELVQLSKRGPAEDFKNALSALAESLPKET